MKKKIGKSNSKLKTKFKEIVPTKSMNDRNFGFNPIQSATFNRKWKRKFRFSPNRTTHYLRFIFKIRWLQRLQLCRQCVWHGIRKIGWKLCFQHQFFECVLIVCIHSFNAPSTRIFRVHLSTSNQTANGLRCKYTVHWSIAAVSIENGDCVRVWRLKFRWETVFHEKNWFFREMCQVFVFLFWKYSPKIVFQCTARCHELQCRNCSKCCYYKRFLLGCFFPWNSKIERCNWLDPLEIGRIDQSLERHPLLYSTNHQYQFLRFFLRLRAFQAEIRLNCCRLELLQWEFLFSMLDFGKVLRRLDGRHKCHYQRIWLRES